MNLPALAIEKKPITYFAALLILLGGIACYFQLGQLEDPEFTVKTAAIITQYPGASAQEVELEVTDPIETKLQEMVEVKRIYSNSRAGISIIKVDIKNNYWADRLPQVWDILRKKIKDMQDTLPPGAGEPSIGDDYGFVYGFMLAMTGDGYSYGELEQYAKELRKELNTVPGVSRVLLHGVQPKRIYIDISQAQMAELGLTGADIQRTLLQQNMVVDAGHVEYQDQRFRIAPTGEFKSPEEIGKLAITTSSLQDTLARMTAKKESGEIIRLRDIGTVTTGYLEPPTMIMRHNGMPAIGILMAPSSGENVVDVGRRVDERLNSALKRFPVGIEVEKISWQSDMVDQSIKSFMISLAQAVIIVLLVLVFTMGMRTGIIIGITGLVYPILGTFIVMAIMGIDLQRVSLGALIIAMGMMVDNAIVVADGIMVRIQQGMDRTKAAIESASQPAIPLLGATVVASLAFYPIFASKFDTGEYARSLFQTVAISLLLSWVFSQTIAPLLCIKFMPEPKSGSAGEDAFGGPFFTKFRGLLHSAIKFRMLFLACMVGLLLLSVWGFGFTNKMYFPDSSRTQFMIDYWLSEGTRIAQTSADLKKIEARLMEIEGVTGVTTFVGQGQPRFYLPVVGEDPYPSFGQIIVNTNTLENVDAAMSAITPWLQENFPQAMSRVRKYGVGSFNDWKIEARFSGPWNASPDVLRDLAAKGMAILNDSPYSKEVRTNWRTRTRTIVPKYNQERGRYAGIGRTDIANASKRSYEGIAVGLYRDNDDLIPIIVRNRENERKAAVVNMGLLQVTPPTATQPVPLDQVVDGIVPEWEDPIIWRWNRRRAITVQCSPKDVSTQMLFDDIREKMEAIPLPEGYTLEWHGEYNSQLESSQALNPGILPALVMMVFIIVLLFNAYRPPLIIFIVIPFAVIGITIGLLITGAPFGFMALLGAMSLSGMMIKNSVVLLDQINIELEEGQSQYEAVVRAAVCRVRPVVNAAATTVFGMIPLLGDVFWYSMAITIMFGLAFGTILTMVVVPVLYATLYRIKTPQKMRI
jgi:multidrug efflux pump subunit AcrB